MFSFHRVHAWYNVEHGNTHPYELIISESLALSLEKLSGFADMT